MYITFGDIVNYIIQFFTQLEKSIRSQSTRRFSDDVKPESSPGVDLM